jgi:hypothetical protein
MAAPIDSASNGDDWNLSIEDLFATLPEKARLGGPGPFVINLSVSAAPIELPPRGFDGCPQAHLYQLQRTEDRRPRYRLRLGPFAREDEADAVLEKVRDSYPGALTATADGDDLRAIAALQAKAYPSRVAASSPVMDPARREPPSAAFTAAPSSESAARRVAAVESTQTVRALTVPELKDAQSLRWFVVQLSLSEEAFDSEAVPILDIFNVYRLYSVAGIDQGRIVHALRLGFFSEEVAAGAVASYLAAFYDNPVVKRVSTAERDRFADQRFEPRKDIGATGRHAVIEITNERYVRERRVTALHQKSK